MQRVRIKAHIFNLLVPRRALRQVNEFYGPIPIIKIPVVKASQNYYGDWSKFP